ncbi:MAG: endonuclease/exonuclease/phosphatase family protein, partial [Chitinispirillaceae bacterium]|nr:endonuclease/exonuclease/phosphatase family protein [Chitinispirillaceae bacterium]
MEKRAVLSFFISLTILATIGFSKDRDKISILKREKVRVDTFSLVFYNVENLFDYEIDGNEYPEYRPGFTNWDREMYLCKLRNIASVLIEINADIVALCEVEDIDALKALQNTLMDMGYKYKWATIGEKKPDTKTVPALLSRFPFASVLSHWFTLPDSSFARPILEVNININSRLLKVFVNHWPSRYQKESFRIAAAKKLREIISLLPPATDYIIVGDLNSNYNEFSTIKSFGLDDSKGITGINHILSTIYFDSSGFECFYNETLISALQSKLAHYNLWLELPESKRMSYFYKGNLNTLDHIILPPTLYDSVGISYVDNSFQVITLNGKLLTTQGEPKRWKSFSKNGKKI